MCVLLLKFRPFFNLLQAESQVGYVDTNMYLFKFLIHKIQKLSLIHIQILRVLFSLCIAPQLLLE